MKVLIAGCGYTGTALGLGLASEGHEAWGLRRSPGGLPAPIRPLAADLAEPSGLDALPTDFDAVVYAASADVSERVAYRRAYVTGLENLLRSLRAPGARLVFVSSTAVYGENDGGPVDEDSAPDPDGFRGEILLEAEELAAEWDGPSSVVRASGIYGPGRDRLLRLARAGDASWPGERWTNRIHRDDLAGAIRHALRSPSPSGLYLASDREPALLGEVLAWIARELGEEAPTRLRPRGDGEGAAGPVPGKRCLGRRLPEEGFSFRHPSWREGYRSMLEGHP